MENSKLEEYKRVKQVAQYMNVAESTIWLFSKQGKLHPIKLSDRVTVWAKSDIDTFIASRMAVA